MASDARPAADGRPLYFQDLTGWMAGAIAENGLSSQDLAPWLAKADGEVARLRQDLADGSLDLLTLPAARADIAPMLAALERLSQDARTLVFLGTGGSALGGETLAQVAGWNIPGALDEGQRGRPRTRFYDNLDADTLAGALNILDLATSRFVVTSKSGNTAETLAQAIVAIDAVKAAGLGARLPELFLGITEPTRPGVRNGLRQLFSALAIPMLDHATGIGGRYSVLTNVGLMPAAARGLDPVRLREGAATVVAALAASTTAAAFAPALGAASAIALAAEKGVRVHVVMPYADRLAKFGHWFVQLWAESLGKSGRGTTPLACLGPLDQHSQLQLFMDGPREHALTVIRVATQGSGGRISPELARLAGIDELGGRTIGDLVAAEAAAVPDALRQVGRPVRTFDLGRRDEHAIGALLMHFMLETIIAGRLLGIDPFDQPAVELAKSLTRARIGTVAAT